MALTPSNPFAVGTLAPAFILPEPLSGQNRSLDELKGEKGTVVMFICNHCPFVKHINDQLVHLAQDYISNGISFIAISSNDVANYPEDAPELMAEQAKNLHYPFPYLYDESQAIAKAYDAACTPDFYLFDANLRTTYHGQLDDSRPGNGIPVSGKDLRAAIDALLLNKAPLSEQKVSIGCGIKWKQ